MIGKTISHYKILEKLGEGGMGVVYKAEDTKLERTVALKFLLLASIGDEEKKRFKREAKAAAALNHSNICHIYAIDEVDDQTFIAMEYIEGQSLEDLVGANGGKPMPIEKAIDYATQTAAGLQAAHEKGITHRDIKSANIMVTKKGQIKIMDFGLAKLANRSKLTQLGTTLGTAAYMSPEQSRGENTDHRSDIWSLGVVLYEMISGQMPFKGDYEQAVIYSIQNEEPEPLTSLRSGVPMALDGVIAKALAKEADTRYQHVDELPADLKGLDSPSISKSRISAKTVSGQANARTTHQNRVLGLVATFMLGLIVAGLAVWVMVRPGPTLPKPVKKFAITLPENEQLSLPRGRDSRALSSGVAISPDGAQLVYVASDGTNRKLYLRRLEEFNTTTLSGTDGAGCPFFSPDGQWVGFYADGKLKKVQLAGGKPVDICEVGTGIGGAAWGTDDNIILGSLGSGLMQVSASGGAPQPLTTPEGSTSHRWPEILPGGEPGGSQVAPERKMLVVLPFENLGPPEQAYFAAGMTEEITSRLAAVSGLGVISRSSAARYDRAGKTLKEIARDFGVDYVLDGTVRWNPSTDGDNKVRITPELIGISDGTQLWSERYDRVIDDIFVVQSEIAAQVVQKLGVTLLVADRQIIEAKPTDNIEAYDYYLRGNDYSARRTVKKDAEIAVQMYEKAVELDPKFAVAYAALSRARMYLYWTHEQIHQIPKAKDAMEKARQLAPDLAETHLAWGYYYYHGSRDYDNAMEHFTIVQRRRPNDAEVTAAIGFIRRRQGKWEQAAAQLEQAVELDPRNSSWLTNLGQTHYYMRRYAQAERYLDRAIAVAPDIPNTYIRKIQLYLSWFGSTEKAEQVLEDASSRIGREVLDKQLWALGRVYVRSDTLAHYLDKAETHYYRRQTELAAQYADSARIILQAEIKAHPENQWLHQWLGWAYAYLDRHEEAIREARKAVKLTPVSKDAFDGCIMLESLALLYTVVGEHDAAIDQLEYLLTIPSLISVPRLKFQPVWEPLHQHPRFKQLLEKHGGESR